MLSDAYTPGKYESTKCELLTLYHLVKLKCISDLDRDISLEVDTTLLSFLGLDHIEWSLLEIGNFS